MTHIYPGPGAPLMGQPFDGPPDHPVHDALMCDLRGQIADRLNVFNAKQAMHAWDRRRSDPLAPHGLALFWADLVEHRVDDRTVARYRLHTGTRLFLDDPEARDRNGMLYDLLGLVQEAKARGGRDWWPHRDILNRCDPLDRHYWYVGAAVSSLDTEDGDWATVANTALSPLHVPGLVHVALVDGSRMMCRRLGRQRLDRYAIRSSASLDYYPGQPTRVYEWDVTLADERSDIWDLLSGFNETIGSRYSGRG